MKGKQKKRPSGRLPVDNRIVLAHLSDKFTIDEETAKKICEGVTAPNKQKFLLYLSVLGNRTRACQAAGISPMSTWLWRRDDDNFRNQYMLAMKIAAELHEDEMFRRASEGVLEPVFQGGRLVGSVRKFSDTLLIFGLKGAMPEKYADRSKVEHSGSVDIVARLRAARQRQRRLKGE